MLDTPKPCVFPEEEEKKNQSVINNVIQYTAKIRLVQTFSVSVDKFLIYEKFREIARREGGTRGFSGVLLKAMAEFNQKHGLGNNQLRIENYCDPNKPSPSTHLCHYGKGNTNDGQVFCANPSMIKTYDMVVLHSFKGAWISGITCYSCKFNKLRKTEEYDR